MSTSLSKSLPLILLTVLALVLGASSVLPAAPESISRGGPAASSVGGPAIDLVKSFMWTFGDGSQVNDEGQYTYEVTNTGDVTLWVDVYDSVLGPVSLPDFLLDPGETTTAIVPFLLTQPLLDQGSITNFADAYGETDEGDMVMDSEQLTVDFLQYPGIDLVKYVSVDGGMTYDDANDPPGPSVPVGAPVKWKFTVENTGNIALGGVFVYDFYLGVVSFPSSYLAPGDSMETTVDGTALEGLQFNEAAVYGRAEDRDRAYYTGVRELTLVKSVGLSPTGPWFDANSFPAPIFSPSDGFYFQFVISNQGSSTLTDVMLTDSLFGPGSTPPFAPMPPNTLGPGEEYTYVYGPVDLPPGEHTNYGTVTASLPTGVEISTSDPVFIIIKGTYTLLQAYPACPEMDTVSAAGYAQSPAELIGAVPGVLKIVPQRPGQPPWANYVRAYLDDYPYTIKNVTLTKTTPEIVQCADVFPARVISQQGTPNIRLWWPLMYEAPGTTWKLAILYGTTHPYDDDGPGPNLPGYVHTDEWEWRMSATIASMRDLLELFHQLPFGLDEVPLISDEVLYAELLAKLDSLQVAVEEDPARAGLILGDFEMEVMDACIAASPERPRPTGGDTGIANTFENPACCKLLADAEFIGIDLGIFQPVK